MRFRDTNARHLPLVWIDRDRTEEAGRGNMNRCTDRRLDGTDSHILWSRIHDVQVVGQPVHSHWVYPRQTYKKKEKNTHKCYMYLLIRILECNRGPENSTYRLRCTLWLFNTVIDSITWCYHFVQSIIRAVLAPSLWRGAGVSEWEPFTGKIKSVI